MRGLEHAHMLLTLARMDLAALRGMGDAETFRDEIFGFHAQQCAEKALKAWIAALGHEFPYRHDLAELLNALEGLGEDVTGLSGLVDYTDFGVRFRYEVLEETEPPLNRSAACSELAALVERAQNAVKRRELDNGARRS